MLMAGSTALTANQLLNNALSGEMYEFMQAAGIVTVAASGSTADVKMTFSVGGVTIAEAALIPGTNRYPILPDDFLFGTGAPAGARLIMSLLETGGAVATVKWSVRID